MKPNQTPIRVHDLTKKFGDFTAVDHIDFAVNAGEIFGFLGPNGSGKTTTIRMMLGLMEPTEGWAEVLGMQVDGDTRKIRPLVGYMSQRFSLYNDLTVRQNLNFYAAAYGLSNSEKEERIREALTMSGLEKHEHTKTKDLSGGWRQRLALNAAILHRPQVLFLDEPTAGVSPLSRRDFWDLLYQLTTQGMTVFITTHYMDEAEHCHQLAFIQHGRIIASGTPKEIKGRMMHGDVIEIEPSDAPKAVKVLRAVRTGQKLAIEEIELYGALVHVVAPQAKKQLRAIESALKKADIQIRHISIIEPSLEDVFISAMNV